MFSGSTLGVHTVPVIILGGLPVMAECVWTKDYWGEYDAHVEAMYWIKRNGTQGKEIPQSIIDRLERSDKYWESDVIQQAENYLNDDPEQFKEENYFQFE